MNTHLLFEQLITGRHLSNSQMQEALESIMSGQWSDVEIATFLALMRMKGETLKELQSAALVMQKLAHPIDLGNNNLVDIVGTGGDGKSTFNVSTVSGFVAAAAGAQVAKHGNRSSTSATGSADFLSQAGFALELSDPALRRCMQQCHMVFLFGPHFHPAMHHVKTARRQLGIRTLFNLIGPLINPAQVKKQVVGVCSKAYLQPIAQVLVHLGSEHALVVHSEDGLDEISMAAPTTILEVVQGEFKSWILSPKDHGLYNPNFESIVVDSPEQSLIIAESVFAGEKGPARDIVILNAAATLYCANPSTFEIAIEEATAAIDTGRAGHLFIQLRDLTQTEKRDEHV